MRAREETCSDLRFCALSDHDHFVGMGEEIDKHLKKPAQSSGKQAGKQAEERSNSRTENTLRHTSNSRDARDEVLAGQSAQHAQMADRGRPEP